MEIWNFLGKGVNGVFQNKGGVWAATHGGRTIKNHERQQLRKQLFLITK